MTGEAKAEGFSTQDGILQEKIATSKEEAVKEALEKLGKICSILKQAPSTMNFDSDNWISSYNEILYDHESFEFYIGVGGDTGMGKSSLLNAFLFNATGVAPSSQHGACTATICCFKHHEASGNDKFKAVIRFKSKSDVDHEISRLFQDKAALGDEDVPEDKMSKTGNAKTRKPKSSKPKSSKPKSSKPKAPRDEITQAEIQSIEEQLNSICGWSGLSRDQISALGSVSPESITSACKRSTEFFNESKPDESCEINLSCSTLTSFSQKLRSYVSSAGPKTDIGSKVYWPIVECVYIYAPSAVLRKCPGLVLADLPGETDASEARSEVARRFYNRLDKLLAVTPADRANDNRTTADFIRSEQFWDLEADGKMHRDFLTILISKIDLLDWKQYVPHEVEPHKISDAFPEMLVEYEDLEARLEAIQDELQEMQDTMGQTEQDTDAVVKEASSSLKRIHDSNATDEISELKKREAQLLLQRRDMEVKRDSLDGKCLRACIDYRSRTCTEEFIQSFTRARNQYRKEAVETYVQVLSVSSKAQRMLLQRNPMIGFNNSADTGFDDLSRWMIDSSVQKRVEHADSILHRSTVLFDAIEGCIRDDEVVYYTKLPQSRLAEIEQALKDFQDNLQRKCERQSTNFGHFFTRQTIYKSRSKSAGRQAKLVDAFKQGLDGFRFSHEIGRPPLHFATFHACLRRNGGPFKANGKIRTVHHWQSRLYSILSGLLSDHIANVFSHRSAEYWSRAAEDWRKTFANALPRYASLMIKTMRTFVSSFEQQLTQSDNLPSEFKVAFKKSTYRVEHYIRLFQTGIHDLVSLCRRRAASLRKAFRKGTNTSLEDFFADAKHETGRGKFDRQKQKLNDLINNDAERIVSVDLDKIIRQGLAKIKSDAIKMHREKTKELSDKTFELAGHVAKQVCSTQTWEETQDQMSESMKESLHGPFMEWDAYWKSLEPQIREINIGLPKADETDEELAAVKAEASDDPGEKNPTVKTEIDEDTTTATGDTTA